MAFQPLFRLGKPAQTGGYRGLLAFWAGGAAAGEAVAPPEEPQVEIGSSISGGTFSRGRWRKLQEEWREEAEKAQREAEQKAQAEKRKSAKLALARLVKISAQAVAAAEDASLQRLTLALEALSGVEKVAEIVRRSRAAERIAKEILEEEEEAIMLLMSI